MKLDFSELMATSDLFLGEAENLLIQRLKSNPNDENALWQLAETLRQAGNMESALERYRQLLSVNPDHTQAAYLSAILGQESLVDMLPDQEQPAPFVRTVDFLTSEQQELIWKHVQAHARTFSSSRIEGGQLRTEYRNSHVMKKDKLAAITPFFLDRVLDTLAEVCPRIQISPFTPGRREIQLTMHLDGEFFKVHKDSADSGIPRTRRVTFVYYFHSDPRRFRGGDLLLFDTDLERDLCTNKYTRIPPTNNSMILFPSDFYHQVTPVICESERFEHGRFTLNGWLHDEGAS